MEINTCATLKRLLHWHLMSLINYIALHNNTCLEVNVEKSQNYYTYDKLSKDKA